MARKTERLTNVGARKAKEGMHADGNGLYLQVVGNARSWLFRYSVAGRDKYCGLGSLQTISLTDARQEAQRCRQMRLEGIDPIEARAAARAANALAASQGTTFREAAEALIGAKVAGWKNPRQEALWRQTLTDYAYPTLGALAVPAITTNHVLKVLEPIWHELPETAGRVRARIEAVWDVFKARNPEARMGENPARWKGHLAHLLAARGRGENHAALAYAEMAPFMGKLRERDGITSELLELTILTAARSGETRAMRVGEIDLAKAEWRCPGERMKMGREHIVPLSPRALEIVRKHAEGKAADALLFPNGKGRPFSDMALLMVLRRMGVKATVHGFRSTFRDWAGDETDFPSEIAEFALAHVVGAAAEAAYRRGTALAKRGQLMKAWADYCAGIAPEGAKVIQINRAAV